VLKEMEEGRDIEVGEGGGPSLTIGKKKSSNKRDMHKEGSNSSGGFLSGFKSGFLNR
jgi:hypothetical protein